MKTKLAFSIWVLALVWPAFFLPAQAVSRTLDFAPPFPSQDIQGAPRIQKLLDFKTGQVRDDGSSGLQRRRLAGEKAPASLNAVLLMCDFSDSLMYGRWGQVPGDFPEPMQSEFYYAAHDSVFFDHLLQDVKDYYTNVSGGQFTLNYTIHPEVVNLPNPMGFYGNHPDEGEQSMLMATEVVSALDADIDFSVYDTLILVHAGAGEETDILSNSPEQIYSTYLDPDDFHEAFEDSLIDQPYIPTNDHPDGMGLDHVLVLPETEYQDLTQGFGGFFGSLGVYCFEVGLRLGMLSLSDFTPAGRPDSQGIGEFGLMGYGLFVGMGFIPPHPCAFNKHLMGWLDPQEVSPLETQELFLTPSEQTENPESSIRVDISGQEYWLLAYRLQDPDGNRIFTHPGDLNGNNIPDFYDADSSFGGGIPSGFFDPETDTRERLLDCEWDFFMSENSARQAYEKGAGSGVYIWHIDEGVVQWAFQQSSNLFNANAERKSVDLEEADGIQDLDSREPSPYQLGGDDDSFRGEGQDHFDAFSNPGTESAGGAFTGVRFADFSHVVEDSAAFISYINNQVSPPDTIMGFTYADTIRFTLSTVASTTGGGELTATRDLPSGIDLRGSHLVTADLDGDGADEIIAAGQAGEVLVFDQDLNEFLDHDSNPETLAPFAVGTSSGEPVAWNLPPAVGNIDDDPEPEIVLTGPTGIYAFNGDGTPVHVADAASVGLYLALDSCTQPAVMVPMEADSLFAPAEPVWITYLDSDGMDLSLGLVRGDTPVSRSEFLLGSVTAPSPPVYSWGKIMVAVADTLTMEYGLQFYDPYLVGIPENPSLNFVLPLVQEPGSLPPALGLVEFNDPENSYRYVTVLDTWQRGETIVFNADGEMVMDSIIWDHRVIPESGLSAGGAFITHGLLGRAGHNGEWLDGWPYRPLQEIAASPSKSGPLVCEIVGADLSLSQYLFPTSDGRIFGMGTRGETLSGWPVIGPGQSSGTMALGHVLGNGTLDLVASGTFDRITGLDALGDDLTTDTVTTLSLWSAVAEADAAWPMWGANPWHNGQWDMAAWRSLPGAASGTGIVEGSHLCYPSPLVDSPLHVRASSRSVGRAQAEIYNLSGELVQSSEWQQVSARDPFAIAMNLDGVVSGMYMCRLTVVAENGSTDHSVISLAVVR